MSHKQKFLKLRGRLIDNEDILNVSFHQGNEDYFVVAVTCSHFTNAVTTAVNDSFREYCIFACNVENGLIVARFTVHTAPDVIFL